MTDDDVRAVLATTRSFDPATGVALRLAAVAGLRRAELAALQWVDLDGAQLRVDSRRVRDPPRRRAVRRGRSHQDRRTRAPSRSTSRPSRRLRSCIRFAQQVSPYMFSDTSEPANPDRIGWWWSRARERSGIDRTWRLHDLRHWTATMAITSGHDVRTVAGRLGHANPAMTLRVYAHAVEGADRVLASDLAGMLDDGYGARTHDEARVDTRRAWTCSPAWAPMRAPSRRSAVATACAGSRCSATAFRDDFTPESDVDLLVEFLPDEPVSLFDMARMETELEEIVGGHRVDLRTPGDLGARFRDDVVAEAEAVYDVAA